MMQEVSPELAKGVDDGRGSCDWGFDGDGVGGVDLSECGERSRLTVVYREAARGDGGGGVCGEGVEPGVQRGEAVGR